MRRLPVVLLLALAFPPWAAAQPQEWRPALPGYAYRFPRDHGSHPAFRTEWWYYSGHLSDPSGGRYAFMLTFFRSGLRPPAPEERPRLSRWALRNLYFAHLALLDARTGEHRYFERKSRGALEEAGAAEGGLDVWLGGWRARGSEAEGRYVMEIAAEAGGAGLRLALLPQKPPVIHGEGGVIQKAEGRGRASHYVSFTRLAARGEIMLRGRRLRVEGSAWMDHEFGSNQLAPGQAGWDWLSLQLSDGRDLMLYLMRRREGGHDPRGSGTIVEKDGRARHLPLGAFRLEGTGRWRSPESGAEYPMGWRVQVPAEGIDLTLRPLAEAQELRTSGSTRVTYWEGGVEARGRSGGAEATGLGFVEMTGYAGKLKV